MEPIKPSPDIYRKAARIIEEEGWARNHYSTKSKTDPSKKCYCMEGAIMVAAGLPPTHRSTVTRGEDLALYADNFVYEKTKRRSLYCVDFNDESDSSEPVITMLNDIADALEKDQANA